MIFKIYADLLISGDKFWVDIPTKNDTKNKVDAVLKQYVVDLHITEEQYLLITGQAYVAQAWFLYSKERWT